MRTRHPSNTNNPDQEAARVFEATLKLHVAAHPACQWELDWFRACLKKVRRSRRLIDDQLAHAPRPLCDAFMRELALGDRSPSPSPAADRRSSALLTHLPEEHDVAPSDLDTSLDSIADLARPRPGSLSPQISPRATIPGTPYDEPPSATSSIAPTPKVPGAFFASVQSLVPSNGASPAIHPHAMEPGPSPEPLPNPQPDQRPQTNVPEIFIAPDEPTPRFERPSPFDHPEIPRVHSVSPHTSFPGDVPNQDACPIYSTSAGDVPNARTDDDRRPNPLRLPGAYAPSETSLTPSQSVEDLTTPVDNKTPTETPITPGLELDLFPKPPSTGLAPVVTVPSVNVISGPSALSPISPKVPGAYAPSIFDATPAMSPVPLEPMSPHPAFEDDSPNSTSESVTDTLVDDESTTPVQETLPIPRGVSYNPILAGQTTNRASRSFPIDETALEGQTPTTEPSTPFVLIPSPERLDVGHRPSPPGVDTPVSDLTTDSWEDVSPSNDSGSPSDALESRQDKAPGKEVEEPAEPDTEISPASVPVVDAAKQAQDEALPVQDVENAPEPVPAGKPAADVPDEQTHVSPAPVDSEAAPEPEQLSSEPKVEQPTSEPVHEAPSPLPTETIDRPVSNVVLAVSESGPASEVEPHPAPPVDATIGATPPGVVHEDTLTRVSDSGPRPELESATLVRTEVVQAGETPVPEAEPTREPENDQAKQEVHPVSREADQPAVEQASAEEPEPRTKDVPEAPVVQPAVLVQEAVEADSQVEKLEQPAEPTDVHVAPEPEQPALELQQEALPEGPATLATEPEIPSVPSLEPLEAPVTADAQPSLPLGPEEHAVTHEESVLPKEPAVEHPAIVPPAQEAQKEQTENELEQAPQAAEIDARDAPLTQPVEAKLPIVAALASVDSISPKPVSSDQPAEPATLAHITSNTVSSQPEQSIDEPATPEHAPTLSAPPAAPTGVADMETSEVVRVVEQPETIASGLDSVHQPAVPDIQLLISEPPKLGASEATSVGPEVESADESESAADSESVHTPPATVADTSLNPTARAKELSQEANKLSEKFAAYGDVDDLDDAIELYGRAAELLAPGSEVLDVSSYLNLGRMMRVKFEAFNDIPDLEAAINDSLLKAYDILKSDPAHESYCDVLYELGAASLDRYLYDASKTAGDEALDYCQKALNASASPAGPKYADIRSVMSRLHLARFEYLSDAEDAEKALEHLDAAASAHVAIEREPKYTENRARVLFACYQTGRQEYDDRLEQALSLAQEAVNRTLEGSIHYPIASTFLAEVLLARYERFSDRADLDAAHRYLEEAVQEVPYVSPDQPWVGERLARALIAKFVNDGNSEDLDDAIAFLEIALNLTVANPYRRQPRLDAFGRALTLRFRHRALGESTTGDGLRELMAGGDSL